MVRKENQRRSLAKEDAIKPFHDKKAGVKYVTFGHDQWVSFVSHLVYLSANCSSSINAGYQYH